MANKLRHPMSWRMAKKLALSGRIGLVRVYRRRGERGRVGGAVMEFCHGSN